MWNDSYPSIAEIEHDLETKNMYVMTDDSKVIGAISVVPEYELDDFDCWPCKDGKAIHLSVVKTNVPAYKTYIKAGFAVDGEAQMYGNDYYLMEKAIDT